MSLFKKPSAKLSIEVPMRYRWIHPPSGCTARQGDLPVDELVLDGTVTLTLLKEKLIDSVVVRLRNEVSIRAAGLSLEEVLLDREIVVKIGEVLEQGTHQYSFAFPIPASTAPRERLPQGNIFASVTAMVTGPKVQLKEEEELWIFANPCKPNELSPDLDFVHNSFGASFGIYRVEFLSPAVTAGALVRCHLVFEGPAETLVLHRLQFACNQTLTFRSLKDPSKTTAPIPSRYVFRTIDCSQSLARCTSSPSSAILKDPLPIGPSKSVPFFKAKSGERTSLTTLQRLPKDDLLRPSTRGGTRTPILIKHDLELSITYSTAIAGPKTLVLSTPIEISSCTLVKASVVVPEYDVHDPNPPSTVKSAQHGRFDQWADKNRAHVCVIPTETLVEQAKNWQPPYEEQAILEMRSREETARRLASKG